MNIIDIKMFSRTLLHSKLYTAVTVLGFALSLTFVILLSIYIQQELSVDQFHEKKNRIFRVTDEFQAGFGATIGGDLQAKYPEIESYTRLTVQSGYIENIRKEKISSYLLAADSTFFTMFSFPLLEGNPQDALRTKNSIVITRSYARRLFDNQSAMGQEILFSKKFRLQVTGIIEDMPDNTHFNKCDGFFPLSLLADIRKQPRLLQDNHSDFGLYILTNEGADLSSKAPQMIEDLKKYYWEYQVGGRDELNFEPLTDAYFSGKEGDGTHGNNTNMVLILSAIVIAILVLALINYNNLSLAQAGFRAKEAAVKKLLGTSTRRLFIQFITESVILCLASFILALFFSMLAEPIFNNLMGTRISVIQHLKFSEIVCSLAAIVLLGITAGFSPAFIITRFNAVDIVKGAFRRESKGTYGKLLICFQITTTIVLVICALLILKQNRFIQNYDLGFDKENIVWLQSKITPSQKEALRNELRKLPEVIDMCYTIGNPLDGGQIASLQLEKHPIIMEIFKVDSSFFSVWDIKVTPTDVAYSKSGFWVTKLAVKTFGEDEEIQAMDRATGEPTFKNSLGTTGDFHSRNLKQSAVSAIIELMQPEDAPLKIFIKVPGQSSGEAYRKIQKVYGDFIQKVPFESGFVDHSIRQWYKETERDAKQTAYFSILAIALSMMGILAMATFYIQQRRKEIGLRRINGGSVNRMLQMLLSGFLLWIVIAFVIACPLAWYIMNQWLSNFAYRTEMSWWIFAGTGLFACLIALLMVGWQSYKAATANPVEALKNE